MVRHKTSMTQLQKCFPPFLSLWQLFLLFVLFNQLSGAIVSPQKEPAPELLELLTLMEIAHDGSLRTIAEKTQTQWNYPTPLDRWLIEESFGHKKEAALPLLERIGCINKVTASQKHYDYAFVMGGTIHAVRERLSLLIEEWQGGVRFEQIIFVTQPRLLDLQFEAVPKGITTERQMIEWVYANSYIPQEMRHLSLHMVNALNEWLDSKPTPGSCLLVSSQPLVGYQEALFQRELLPNFRVEAIGKELENDRPLTLHLGLISTWLQVICYEN